MSSKDFEIARKIGEFVRHFSAEWSEYQDWLRDIVASRSILEERHPNWLAVTIFRWRLLYFVAYVVMIMMIDRSFEKLKDFCQKPRWGATIVKLLRLERYSYILQRTATLLAVAELTLCGIAAFTGILLAFNYQPSALGAYDSLMAIANEVSNGALILSLHNFAGNSLIVLALVQIVVMFLGRQRFSMSWLTAWISGICLTLTAIGLSWTAIILNWEHISFWRFKIELSIVASIPLVGSNLRSILLGGNSINSITVQHMYALHSYILVIAAIFLSVTHLTALVFREQNRKSEAIRLNMPKLCGESASEKNTAF